MYRQHEQAVDAGLEETVLHAYDLVVSWQKDEDATPPVGVAQVHVTDQLHDQILVDFLVVERGVVEVESLLLLGAHLLVGSCVTGAAARHFKNAPGRGIGWLRDAPDGVQYVYDLALALEDGKIPRRPAVACSQPELGPEGQQLLDHGDVALDAGGHEGGDAGHRVPVIDGQAVVNQEGEQGLEVGRLALLERPGQGLVGLRLQLLAQHLRLLVAILDNDIGVVSVVVRDGCSLGRGYLGLIERLRAFGISEFVLVY